MSGRRTQAREAALQILYFWEIGGAQPITAIQSYFAEHRPDADEALTMFTTRIVLGTIADVDALDRAIEQHARHWRIERIAVIDRLILRLAVWELRHETETPAAVVLNEALELTRRFSSDDAVRFVNGVLDAIRRGDGTRTDGAPDPTPTPTD